MPPRSARSSHRRARNAERHRSTRVAAVAALMAATAALALACSTPAAHHSAPTPTAEQPQTATPQRPAAPTLEPLTMLDAQPPLDPLRDVQARLVVLDFFSIWCDPCLEGLPAMVELEARYREHGVAFVVVAQDDDPDALRKVLERHGVTFPVALDPDQRWFDAFSLRYVPSVVVLDAERRVALRHASIDTLPPSALAATLDELLAEP